MDEETMDRMLAASPENRIAKAGFELSDFSKPNLIELSRYQRFIALSRYARYLPEARRRETWEETVERYCSYMADRFPLFPRAGMEDGNGGRRVGPPTSA